MWQFILAFLIHAAYSCENMMEIGGRKLANYEDAIGNWSNVYQWDRRHDIKREFRNCLKAVITEASEEAIEAKKLQCAARDYPFKWTDAKLKFQLAVEPLEYGLGLIFMDEDDNWLLVDCVRAIRVILTLVGDDFMLITHRGADMVLYLLARSTSDVNQLKYIVHHINECTGLRGMATCN